MRKHTEMNRPIHTILLIALMWLLPSWAMAGVVRATATLGNTVIEAEYTINGLVKVISEHFQA